MNLSFLHAIKTIENIRIEAYRNKIWFVLSLLFEGDPQKL